jgi:hypothetical protein
MEQAMKVVDTGCLLKALERARIARVNRQLHESIVKRLDPDGKHIFSRPMSHRNYHGVDSIRPIVGLLKLCNETDPLHCVLDFLPEDYNSMPEHKE